jgi:hypothetical protein
MLLPLRARRVLWTLMRPLLRRMLPLFADQDPWERLGTRVALHNFGPGSTREFGWYFEGESRVAVDSLESICDWLLACEYAFDEDLFHEPDFWQHPRTLEHLGKGDCEDQALWAWRKLLELGYETELVSGSTRGENGGSHVWVVFREEGEEYLLEATATSRDRMVRRLAHVRDEYEAHFAVDHRFQRSSFAGYLHALRRRLAPGSVGCPTR